MQIIFFRHAEAEPVGPNGDDASRRLTDEGWEQAERSAQGIRQFIGRVDLVLTSPLPRASQTAEVAGKIWKAQVETLNALGTQFSARQLSARLGRVDPDKTECICLVGHEPDLSQYVGMLIGSAEAEAIKLTKSGAACVWLDGRARRGGGTLEWLMTRKQLGLLAQLES